MSEFQSPGTVRVYRIKDSNIPLDSEAGSPVQSSDNIFTFRVPGGVDEVLIEGDSAMSVIMKDNMQKTTAQFDMSATNLPDIGKSAERDQF